MLNFKKAHIRDIGSPLIQRELSQFTRIAKIIGVDTTEGLCHIAWLDRPGGRNDVIITQANDKDWHMPERGAIVLVAFDHRDQARIVRYINLGQPARINSEKSLPKLKEGEKLWEVGGSLMHMKRNGDIHISTLTQGYLILESASGTLKSETINWRVLTEAGSQYAGLVKRFVTSGTEVEQQTIKNEAGDAYVEHRIKVVETADSELGTVGLNDPLVDITIGTYVTDEGDVVNKNNEVTVPLNPTKALDLRIALKSGVVISIDKEGRIDLSGVKMNFNKGSVDKGDGDIDLGLETNDEDKGDRGQHVAREHDKITVPLGITANSDDHKGLNEISQANLSILRTLATAFVSPSGPCTLNDAVLIDGTNLEGMITEGSENIIVGDE